VIDKTRAFLVFTLIFKCWNAKKSRFSANNCEITLELHGIPGKSLPITTTQQSIFAVVPLVTRFAVGQHLLDNPNVV